MTLTAPLWLNDFLLSLLMFIMVSSIQIAKPWQFICPHSRVPGDGQRREPHLLLTTETLNDSESNELAFHQTKEGHARF